MEEFEIEAKKEFEISFSELEKSLPTETIGSFYQRLDNIIENTLDDSPAGIACGRGCTYCCYYKVEAKPVEIFKIVQFVKSKFNQEQIQTILNQAKENVDEAQLLTYKQHLATNQKCPFLINDECSVYEVRPSKCRNFHATEVELCKKSYDKPTDLSIPSSYNELLHLRTNGATIGFEQAIECKGFDSTTYDLNSALIETFQNHSLTKRYAKGKRAFIKATKIELPE